MLIQFCEFCGNVMREETDYCNICGCHLAQSEDADTFNNPDSPWPFKPVMDITLRIQGCPHKVHFDGTHSLFHLWRGMHRYYTAGALWFRIHHDEMELASFPEGRAPSDFRILEPGDILNCTVTHFSCYGNDVPDPELGLDPNSRVKTYQGSFDITDCPPRDLPLVLGWLLANGPEPHFLEGWVYDI